MSKQIQLDNVNIEVQSTPDYRVLVLRELNPGGDVFIVPMPNEVAAQVGQGLSAPSVAKPTVAESGLILGKG